MGERSPRVRWDEGTEPHLDSCGLYHYRGVGGWFRVSIQGGVVARAFTVRGAVGHIPGIFGLGWDVNPFGTQSRKNGEGVGWEGLPVTVFACSEASDVDADHHMCGWLARIVDPWNSSGFPPGVEVR